MWSEPFYQGPLLLQYPSDSSQASRMEVMAKCFADCEKLFMYAENISSFDMGSRLGDLEMLWALKRRFEDCPAATKNRCHFQGVFVLHKMIQVCADFFIL